MTGRTVDETIMFLREAYEKMRMQLASDINNKILEALKDDTKDGTEISAKER